jgi:phage terminase small subunit
LQAAIRAGYSPKSAGVQACRLLKHVHVQQAIAPQREQAVQARAEAVNTMALSAERTRLEIARLAYFDPRKMFDADGNPLPITKLDDDTAAAIAGIEVCVKGNDEMGYGEIRKVRIADKNAALDKAAKIDGLYMHDNDQKAQGLAAALAEFVGGIHSAGAGRLPFAPPRKS